MLSITDGYVHRAHIERLKATDKSKPSMLLSPDVGNAKVYKVQFTISWLLL